MAGAADRSIAAVVLQIAALRAYVLRSAADRRGMRRSAAVVHLYYSKLVLVIVHLYYNFFVL